MTTDERIYQHALKDLGLKETAGPGSTPRIRAAIKQAASWLDADDSKTAWCGCIRGLWGLETATGVPPAHYRAASWERWGQRVTLDPTHWKQGMTVILTRTGGNHVALLDAVVSRTHVTLLGGNQSDAVSIARYPIARITAVRTAG